MRKTYFTGMVLLTLSVSLCGCPGQKPPEETEPAEVPKAGPAVEEELGPPPAGQTEPPVMETPAPGTEAAQPADSEQTGAATSKSAQQANAEQTSSNPVTLSIMSWEAAQQLVASKAGKVVVLDLWSTSCIPCRREFPHLVQLQKDRKNEVACISYSMDYDGITDMSPESYREKVLDYLKQQGAAFDNVLGNDDPDQLYSQLKLSAIPAVFVYDQEGKLRKRFDNEDLDGGEFTYEADVIPLVEELLSKNQKPKQVPE